ncbi:hypothetical protein [Clostridium kluyveri]|uniref:Uncharacterized protein n=2 Tax=Clostridium kluyveri TaxID=1534 RepID=A5N747_CLOK5|nr:hypothetical protein [Clostridium kluyveri]EDK33128.1 Conserved hypothetical protein [Clostridium kluyveri DSM 555]BAH06039.1 hypothetical protein CKR_0988 [Clostridium kluyveri NBRC 12016]
MNLKIKINIYGNKNTVLSLKRCCNSSHDSSDSSQNKTRCSSCTNCRNNCKNSISSESNVTLIKTEELYNNLKKFFSNSDVSQNIILNFIELDKINLSDKEGIEVNNIIHKGFTPPITVIDGIIRYYAGISNILIYKDVKELLE